MRSVRQLSLKLGLMASLLNGAVAPQYACVERAGCHTARKTHGEQPTAAPETARSCCAGKGHDIGREAVSMRPALCAVSPGSPAGSSHDNCCCRSAPPSSAVDDTKASVRPRSFSLVQAVLLPAPSALAAPQAASRPDPSLGRIPVFLLTVCFRC